MSDLPTSLLTFDEIHDMGDGTFRVLISPEAHSLFRRLGSATDPDPGPDGWFWVLFSDDVMSRLEAESFPEECVSDTLVRLLSRHLSGGMMN